MTLQRKLADYPRGLSPDPRPYPDDGELITLREVVSRLWRGRAAILLTALLFVALAALGVSRMGDRYRATASVMFGTQKPNVVDLKEILTDPVFSKDTLQNEIEVLHSTSLIARVVDQLGLKDNPEFNPDLRAAATGPRDRLRALFPVPGWVSGLLTACGFADPAVPPDPARSEARERLKVIGQVLRGLTLAPIDGTRVIEISFVSDTPETSAAIVNAIADQYIVDQLVAKTQTTRSAIKWLDGRVEEARLQVRRAENAVEAMRAQLARAGGQGLDITEQQLTALNAALSTARGATAEAETRYRRLTEALNDRADMATISEFRDSPGITAYRVTESDLVSQLATMSANHPAVRELRAQLADLRIKIRIEAANIVAAAGIDLATARAQQESLTASVHDLETKSLDQSREEIQLRQLEREADANRLIYETMLKRLKEASEQVELQEADARVLSPADPPLASESSRKQLILAMAAALGAIAGVGLVWLLDQINDTLRAPRQIEHLTGHRVLATIPAIGARRRDPVRLLREQPNSSLAEAVRSLRTSILFAHAEHPPKVVLFTSSVPREGKSTTALLTAVTGCQMGRSAILVDCDLRQPSPILHARAGTHRLGLLSVLDGTATLADGIHRDPETGLHLLLSRPEENRTQVNAADILASSQFSALIGRLSEHYDLVVLDAPPALVVADPRILSAICDTVVYALRWDHTPRGAVVEGLRELESVDAPIAGIVVTMLNESRAARYSFDGYTYYRGRFRDRYIS